MCVGFFCPLYHLQIFPVTVFPTQLTNYSFSVKCNRIVMVCISLNFRISDWCLITNNWYLIKYTVQCVFSSSDIENTSGLRWCRPTLLHVKSYLLKPSWLFRLNKCTFQSIQLLSIPFCISCKGSIQSLIWGFTHSIFVLTKTAHAHFENLKGVGRKEFPILLKAWKS